MGALYVAAGTLHFLFTERYVAIMPAGLPDPPALVLVSGAAEIAAGIGVWMPWPAIRRAAAYGLVALLIAVFPANVTMIHRHAEFPGIPVWVLWARLPLQLPLIAWAWRYTRKQ